LCKCTPVCRTSERKHWQVGLLSCFPCFAFWKIIILFFLSSSYFSFIQW
jgi:hypothetical protein